MRDDETRAAVRRALRLHEIGGDTPYKLFFAGKGTSGASFGFMQGDLAAGPAHVKTTFRAVLSGAAIAAARADAIESLCAVHCIDNPLTIDDTRAVNAALAARAGRSLVDRMDETLLADVYAGLDRCEAAAVANGRRIDPKALVYLAMWINMTGAPTTVLAWLAGRPVNLARPAPRPMSTVDGPTIEAYLRATAYYAENPRNFPHMMECAAAAMGETV